MTVEELLNTDESKIRILIVRHGQTSWNIEKRLQGHVNVSLNEEGFKQAELISERLKDFEIDEFISSDLTRCLQTVGKIIDEKHDSKDGFKLRTTENLRERQMGSVEGMYLKDALTKYGPDFRDLGEKKTDLLKRLNQEWNIILSDSIEHNYKNVLVCTHGGVVTNYINHLYRDKQYKLGNGLVESDLRVPYNTSLTVVDVNKKNVKDGTIQLFGCTKHLGAQLKVSDQRVR